jgi:phage terminase large subunit
MYDQFIGNIEAAKTINRFYEHCGQRFQVIADSASPRDINELQRLGIPATPAYKGSGSIMFGIKAMNKKPINILSSSEAVVEEFDNYKWKVNKFTGVVEDIPEGGKDHAIDASRYVISTKAGRASEYTIG